MDFIQENIIDGVKNADIVLIGIGEEWTPRIQEMMADNNFLTGLDNVTKFEDQNVLLENLKKKYYEEFHSKELKMAYQNLFELCRDKKVFIVSMNIDRYPILSGFKEEQCVFPFGNLNYLQCDNNCENQLLLADDEYKDVFDLISMTDDNLFYRREKCPFCGSNLVFNTIGAKSYCEGGYLEQWELYMKFLQQTINKNLCILELGVSLQYPEVIRKAFEKTLYFNQKAKMFRVNHFNCDIPDNLSEKLYTNNSNSVTYLANLFV